LRQQLSQETWSAEKKKKKRERHFSGWGNGDEAAGRTEAEEALHCSKG
jgi:hypothetical protein